jgi:hypothetical protein
MTARHPNLTGPRTPEGKARSEANLQRGRASHGAYSCAIREPLAERHRQRLAETFPSADSTPGGAELLTDCALKGALRDLYAAHVADHGPLAKRGSSTEATAAARELRHVIDGHERAIVQLQALERERSAGAHAAWDEIALEYSEKRRLARGDTDEEAAP